MSIRISDVRVALEGLVRRDAQRWAGADPFISKKDAAGAASPGWRPEEIRDAAAEVRQAQGKGARVTVSEATGQLMANVESVWTQFNGGDTDVISPDELARMEQEFPKLFALTQRAIEQAERNESLGHPERAQTLADFNALGPDVRERLLDDYGADAYANLKVTPDLFLDELRGKKKAFAEEMLSFLQDEAGDLPDDPYGHIGETKVRFSIVTLPSGEIAGGRVSMFQQGFDREELNAADPPWSFDTAADARAAGYDPTQDISWAVGGMFDSEVKSLRHDTYWEWTGW